MAKAFKISPFFWSSRKKRSLRDNSFLGSLSESRLQELLVLNESEGVIKLLGNQRYKRAVFFNDGRNPFLLKKMSASEPELLVNYVYQKHGDAENHLGYLTVLGDLDNLPLRSQNYDMIVCPFSLQKTRQDKNLNAISKIVPNGGRIIFSVIHPQLEHLLHSERSLGDAVPFNRVSLYYNWLKKSHLYVEELQEVNVDQKSKPFFSSEEGHDHYYQYRGLPLILQFKTVKYQKGS